MAGVVSDVIVSGTVGRLETVMEKLARVFAVVRDGVNVAGAADK